MPFKINVQDNLTLQMSLQTPLAPIIWSNRILIPNVFVCLFRFCFSTNRFNLNPAFGQAQNLATQFFKHWERGQDLWEADLDLFFVALIRTERKVIVIDIISYSDSIISYSC